ncbi:hypothetical protein ACFYV7_10675 [Nocardia suismassiliense]|uniref:Uncharacterized protein n=1 Tax=Nocardia suismassiliense TaxID=2077092 RepID=A0ABW6QPT5_9NOCA
MPRGIESPASDPAIGDTVARLCAKSSDRIPKWVLPVVRQRLAENGAHPTEGRE